MNWYCYIITNISNGKIYIGKTNDLEKRWYQHKNDSKNKKAYLYKAIRKYGIENFTFDPIACYVSEYEAFEMEKFWIAEMKRFSIEIYNLTDGGDGGSVKGRKLTEKTKIKISISKTGKKASEETKLKKSILFKGENNPFYGKHHSQEIKEQMSIYRTGKKASEETKMKISAAQKGKITSEETKIKMSSARLDKVSIIDNFGNIYPSINYAAKKLGLKRSNITAVLKGRRKSTGGYVFKRLEDNQSNINKK